jgi:hypothetical protein
MQTIETYFNDTIAKYNCFKQAAALLIEEIPSLTPEDLLRRCEYLNTLQKEATKNKEQFFIIMEFTGPGILDTSFMGEFQRILDKSILACDILYEKILHYKEALLSQIEYSSPLDSRISPSSP